MEMIRKCHFVTMYLREFYTTVVMSIGLSLLAQTAAAPDPCHRVVDKWNVTELRKESFVLCSAVPGVDAKPAVQLERGMYSFIAQIYTAEL